MPSRKKRARPKKGWYSVLIQKSLAIKIKDIAFCVEIFLVLSSETKKLIYYMHFIKTIFHDIRKRGMHEMDTCGQYMKLT